MITMIYKKYLLFNRRKVSFFIVPFSIMSLIFITYQIWIFWQLSHERNEAIKSKSNLIRGIHEQQAIFYKKNSGNKFTCIHSSEEILYQRINDNYCDCLDGSDEPGTNACPDGIFYCTNHRNIQKFIHSTKVNDGVCDCCDGSDEWDKNYILNGYNGESKNEVNSTQSACPNTC